MAENKKIYTNLSVLGELNTANYSFPNVDGNNGQVLSTDGAGSVTWEDAASGGTGSTSPGGSIGNVQYNDGSGGFDGDGTFTYDSGTANLYFNGEDFGKKLTMNLGQASWQGSDYRGGSLEYNNSLSGVSATTILHMGDLSNAVGSDNSYVLGFVDWSGNTNNVIIGKPNETLIMHTPSDGGGDSNSVLVGYGGITNIIYSGKTFEIQNQMGTGFEVSDNGITFYGAYNFPPSDGSTGQVLQTNGVGNLSWASVSGGTGSTSPAGNIGEVQVNQGTIFGASSALTSNQTDGTFQAQHTVQTGSTSGSTSTVSLGLIPQLPIFGGGGNGISIMYNNPLSGGTVSGLMGGDLSNVGGDDYYLGVGYFEGFSPLSTTYALYSSPDKISLRGGNQLSNETSLELEDNSIGMSVVNSGDSKGLWIDSNGIGVIGPTTISDSLIVGSGNTNNSNGEYTILTGLLNDIASGATGSVLLGGTNNFIEENIVIGAILGGRDNTNNASSSAMIGGSGNTQEGSLSVMIGGVGNTVNASGAVGGTIGGSTYKIPYYNN